MINSERMGKCTQCTVSGFGNLPWDPILPGAVARSEASSLGMQAAPNSIPTSGTFFRGDLVKKTFLRPC